MAKLVLEQLKHKDLEFDEEYLVMFRGDDGSTFFKEAIYYYESPSNMHLWGFSDETDSIEVEVGEEIAIFETPENGIIKGGDTELLDKDDIIKDGFGSAWSAWCPECKQKTMIIMRPGKAQCANCE